MNGNEIITFLCANFPTVMGAIGSITGGLFTTMFLRHNTSSSEFEKIKAGQFKEVADDLLEHGKISYVEYFKANNFLMIAKKADEFYSEMHTDNQNSSESYDFGWFVRFYEAVGNISDDTIQTIWAKILAGEIYQPGSFSIKTIDVLRNISKKDAEKFTKILSHSISAVSEGLFLPHNDKYLDKCNISYSDIMKLSELGLLFNNSSISLRLSICTEPRILFTNNELIMTISSNNGENFSSDIQQYPFTETGKEIASLEKSTISDKWFIEYGRCLANDNNGFKIAIHKIISRNNNNILYEKKNLIDINADFEDDLSA